AEEGTQATHHQRIFRATLKTSIADDRLWEELSRFDRHPAGRSFEQLSQWLQGLVPEYKPGKPASGRAVEG
ncbi:MAG TPA: hypothetical protein VIL47_04250, partial [Candidatus Bipolaricaulota bacterium]